MQGEFPGRWRLHQGELIFKECSSQGEILALYDLFLLNWSEVIDAINVYLAAAYLDKTTQGGVPKAQELLYMLGAPDRGVIGTTHLAKSTLNSPPS
ncbi:hypothetical protein [Erwinia rhapontici]|uniref:hypothetical protein n=1 Tax=Erwinia rhapontici TaxID=55212 RepID=UPI00105E3A06|nr:hypothetical protein [Erwinia rhapontici]